MEEYEFVSEPPEDFTCMVCVKVLNEPHLTDCCGQHFCGVCLEQWFVKQAKKICPHCRSESFSYIRSIPLKRKVMALQIYCPFRKQGCKEIVTVGKVSAHKDGCGFAPVTCNQGCGVSVLRKDLGHHYDQNCPKRKVKCRHCGEEDRFEVIDGDHVTICKEYPMECPKGCGQSGTIKRKDLSEHAKVCPLDMIPCTFSEAGCDAVMQRKDLKSHIESNMQEHLIKMMTSHMELKREYCELKDDHVVLKREHKQLTEECHRLSSQVKTLTPSKQIKLDVDNKSVTWCPSVSQGWVSTPFYVMDGYKFCVKHESGSKVALLLLRGELDDKLKWPINLKYKLEIVTYVAFEDQLLPHVTVQHFSLSDPNLDRVVGALTSRELTTFLVMPYGPASFRDMPHTSPLPTELMSPPPPSVLYQQMATTSHRNAPAFLAISYVVVKLQPIGSNCKSSSIALLARARRHRK